MSIFRRDPAIGLARALSPILAIVCLAEPVVALGQGPSALCDRAAGHAARTTGVPLDVLLAISRVETGRTLNGQLAPWPWAVNRAGEGFWFETAAQAISFANDELAANELNLDVGCFQINLRWHSTGFSSLNAMFDPELNAAYAARFLSALYQSEGGWSQAVAAYHSRNSERAEAYLAKVDGIYTSLTDSGLGVSSDLISGSDGGAQTEPLDNQFPLLRSGEQGGLGSLVPFLASVPPLFGMEP